MASASESSRTLYEVPIQDNGRLILPAALRRSLGLAKGDKVIIETEGDAITLTTARLRRKRVQQIAAQYRQPGAKVVDEFLSEKRTDAAREIADLDDAESEGAT